MFHMNDYLNDFNQENGFLIEIKFAQCSYDWYLEYMMHVRFQIRYIYPITITLCRVFTEIMHSLYL